MSVEHLEGKRTGRPRGSKSSPLWLRAARWALRNLDSPDAVPPSALARRLVALGRKRPDRLVLCLDTLEAARQKRAASRVRAARDPAERDPNTAGGPQGEGQRAGLAVGQPLRIEAPADRRNGEATGPAETDPNNAVGSHDEQQPDGNDAALAPETEGPPQKVKALVLPLPRFMQILRSIRASFPEDGQLIECRVLPAQEEVLFFVRSETFPPVPAGAEVPRCLSSFRNHP
jgi:hypothetical protein